MSGLSKDDVIRMAREAGLNHLEYLGEFVSPFCDGVEVKDLEKFANLVAAAEREACAKVCEDIDAEYEGEDVLATWCAAAIRARGQSE